VSARLSRSPLLAGPKDLSWSLDLDVLPQQLSQLPLPPEKLSGLSGTAKAAIHLTGNKTDLGGTIDVEVDDLIARGKGPLDVGLGVKLEPQTTGLDVSVASGGATIVHIDGKIARPGQGLLAALRDKTPGKSTLDKLGTPAIDLTVDVVKHPVSTLAGMKPALAQIPGNLAGSIRIGGDVKTPTAAGDIATRTSTP